MVIYQDELYILGRENGTAFLQKGENKFSLACHPYEPCTIIKESSGRKIFIHNAFDPDAVLASFAAGRTVRAITGKDYSPRDFCTMLAYAAENCTDTDISFVEGALAIERLKEMGATSPAKAVEIGTLGVRTIADCFSHSKKLAERVMYTDEKKVYLKLKK